MAATAEPRGVRASAKRVLRHGTALVQLTRGLAQVELARKAKTLGAGAGLLATAAFVGILAFLFGLATAAAALMLVLDPWLALLVMFGAMLLLTLVLVLVGMHLLRKATPLAPEQALEEWQLTKRTLKGHGG